MAANPMVSNASVRAALDTLLGKLNNSPPGVIKIWTGTMPATCETADSGTLLVTLTLSSTSFANSVDNSAGGATATANAITSANAGNSGTAGYFRGYDGASNCVIQGTVGTSAADMIIGNTTISAGDPISCSSWTVTLPDGSGSD